MNHLFRQLLFLATLIHYASAVSYSEFLYPVGSVIFEDTEHIAVLYQQGAHLELWLWDPVTTIAFKGLSQYTPAGLTVLPSHTQFSFIDHERIRIKALSKKSPKALDMYPLYDFGLLYWIDDENCYCSARERNNYTIFHITTDGNLYRLIHSNASDYIYPQKVGLELFYIKKDQQGTYTIEKTTYPTTEISICQARLHNLKEECTLEKIEFANEESPRSCLSLTVPEILFTCNEYDKALTFFHMKNTEEGFFLKHIDHPFLERFEKIMTFECWHLLKQKSGTWESKKLFEFSIPLHFMYGENRLYESIFRLLPLYTDEAIFYVSANTEGYLHVYRYSTLNASITCLSQASLEQTPQTGLPQKSAQEEYLFTPYFYKGRGLCGGMVKTEENSLAVGPTMEEAEHGEQIFIFPMVNASVVASLNA